jgi:hypothetical protein
MSWVMTKFVKFLLMIGPIYCHLVCCCHLVMYPHKRWRVFITWRRARIRFTFHVKILSWNFVQKKIWLDVTLWSIMSNIDMARYLRRLSTYDNHNIVLLCLPLQHLCFLALIFVLSTNESRDVYTAVQVCQTIILHIYYSFLIDKKYQNLDSDLCYFLCRLQDRENSYLNGRVLWMTDRVKWYKDGMVWLCLIIE